MKLAIEPFLLDNTLMNFCVFMLTGAWLGVRLRIVPTLGVSVLGAVYALLSLFVLPVLREPYCKLPCFLLISLPLFRRSGSVLAAIPFLLLSAAMTGGTAMMLTLTFGGSVTADGTMIGTVPVRAALFSAAAASVLPRLIRSLLSIRRRAGLFTTVEIRSGMRLIRLKALIDSGNLLTEPLSGLPVILIDRPLAHPTRPIPFRKATGEGLLFGERAESVRLPQYGGAAVDCYLAQTPEPIGCAEAILPERLLPYDWRTKHDFISSAYLGSPARAASNWQTRYLMVRSCKRRTSAAARSGRGSALHRARADRSGGEGQTDRTQSPARRLPCTKVREHRRADGGSDQHRDDRSHQGGRDVQTGKEDQARDLCVTLHRERDPDASAPYDEAEA
jgi:hypothetical protein